VGVKTAFIAAPAIACFKTARLMTPTGFACAITGCDNARTTQALRSRSRMGYVFSHRARIACGVSRRESERAGGFRNADWVVPLYSEANSADVHERRGPRAALLARVGATTASPSTRPRRQPRRVSHHYRRRRLQGDNVVFFFTDDRSRRARPHSRQRHRSMGVRFQIPTRKKTAGRAASRHVPGSFDVRRPATRASIRCCTKACDRFGR